MCNRGIKLEDIGYDEFFKKERLSGSNAGYVPARIIAEHKELYILRNEISEFSAKITGKMMFTASSREDYPAVGDWVLITVLDKEQAVIHEIIERKSVLKRKSAGQSSVQIIASNIDVAFIIQSPDRDYSLNRIERYSALAESGRIKPAVVLSKTDLISERELEIKLAELKDRLRGIEIYATSTVSGKGIDELKNNIKKGLTYCLLGSSGTGKSSIVNMLMGKDLLRTEEIGQHTNRGKHITTHRQLFFLENGGMVIDNPGMREIGLLDSDQGVQNVFSEISELAVKCRFSDCTHTNEPGCAVLKTLKAGELDESHYENYIRLVKENRYNTMTNKEKREQDRKTGRTFKKIKDQLKQFKKYS